MMPGCEMNKGLCEAVTRGQCELESYMKLAGDLL